MKLLVFGATGETGRELVKQSLKLGHFVTVLVRDLQKMDIRYVVPGGGGENRQLRRKSGRPAVMYLCKRVLRYRCLIFTKCCFGCFIYYL